MKYYGGDFINIYIKNYKDNHHLCYILLNIHSKMRMEVVINEKSSSKSISVAIVVWMFCC